MTIRVTMGGRGAMARVCLLVAVFALASCGDDESDAERAARSALGHVGEVAAGGDGETRPAVSWSRDAAELLFVSDRDGNSEIYLTRGADTTWANLTRNESDDSGPVWSPDGSRIAFQRTVRTPGALEENDTNLDIFVMNADGSGVTRLTDHPADDYLPSWSHDGARITFTSWRQEARDSVLVKRRLPKATNHVYIMNADGSDQRRFLDESPGASAGVTWASDGEAMVFARKESKQRADIALASPTGLVIRKLSGDEVANGAPAFSPDNRRVAYHADHGDHSEIVVVDRWGLGRQVIVAEGKNSHPRWSPDGRWLVYTAAGPDGNLDVRAVPVDGGDPVILAAGPGRESDASWRPVK